MLVFAALSFLQIPSVLADGEKIGAWEMEISRDSMTDESITSVHVDAAKARLDYGCGGHGKWKTSMILTTRDFLGGVRGDNFRAIMFRVDDNPPITVAWRYSDVTASASYKDVILPVINAMKGGKKLRVRAITYRGAPVEAQFDITGASDALAFVDRACGQLPQ